MIAPNAEIDERAHVASSASIWHLAQVREHARVGENCSVGRGVYIDADVVVGDNCKIQNYALLYAPAVLEEGVFVGPAAILTNDGYPRAVNSDGSLKTSADWGLVGVTVRRGASIGAAAVVLGGVDVGEWAMVAAGAVVTTDVQAHALVLGVPARRVGWVGTSGTPLTDEKGFWVDPTDGTRYREVGQVLTRT